MKSSILTVILVSFLVLSTALVTQAENEESTKTEQSVTTTGIIAYDPLLVDSIKAIDDMHIALKFNQDIIKESVRVRITKQSDESNVRIGSFSGMQDKNTISIILSDILEPTTAYKLTIISAISDNGVIIKDGADGLKEFTTQEDLPKFITESTPEIEFNAPTNPNAVMIESKKDTKTGSENPNLESVVQVNSVETVEELPLTGIDTTIFVIIAGVLWLILIARRRQV
jgi:hypothetical protein